MIKVYLVIYVEDGCYHESHLTTSRNDAVSVAHGYIKSMALDSGESEDAMLSAFEESNEAISEDGNAKVTLEEMDVKVSLDFPPLS